jgi:hypothetical protein
MNFLRKGQESINLFLFRLKNEPGTYIIRIIYLYIFLIFFIFIYSHRDVFEPYYYSFIESITSLFDTKQPVEEIVVVKEEIKPVEEVKSDGLSNTTKLLIGGVVAVGVITGAIIIVGGTGAGVSFLVMCFDATSYLGGV